MVISRLVYALPSWLQVLNAEDHILPSREARMAFVIAAAQRNVAERSGGPFAAAIFEADTGRMVSIGANLVVHQQCSMLHAEVVAIMLAQRRRGSFDLSVLGPELELVTSCEPCAMCFGAIPWSGVRRVVCGASDADARAIGFDEGPKVDDWAKALSTRGIVVEQGLMRSEAVAVFTRYAAEGQPIYNAAAARP